jgi:signal transduction histidine kinase
MSTTAALDARVLGTILLLESGLPAATDEKRLAQMVTSGLVGVPGVTGVSLCIEGSILASTLPPGTDPPGGACRETGAGTMATVPVATARQAYGAIVFRLSDRSAFDPYTPFIANVANFLALWMENERTAHRVRERTVELEAANKELEAFCSSVSHDLRAPLRILDGFCDALREECGPDLTTDAAESLGQIMGAARRMNELIDGFLRLSRSTRGELFREDVDLSSLAERILAEMARAQPERAVRWQVQPGLSAWCDARLAEVLLSNLLGNAWKYTGRTDNPLISFTGGGDNGARVFLVSDNGAGFDMALAPRLFAPFQRLHGQEDFPGVGIGLATVRRIVDRHGGTISVEAAPGRGATFRFTLAADGREEA